MKIASFLKGQGFFPDLFFCYFFVLPCCAGVFFVAVLWFIILVLYGCFKGKEGYADN